MTSVLNYLFALMILIKILLIKLHIDFFKFKMIKTRVSNF